MQSRDTDITTVLRELALDLFISGYTYFKVCPTTRNNGIRIKPLSPLNTFIESNPESPYIKTSNRAVVRHWMTKTEILSRYGK
jgi:hypothetical protein